MTLGGDRRKYLSINDGIDWHRYPFILRLGLMALPVLLVEHVVAHVSGVGQQLLHPVACPFGTPAQHAALAQMHGNLQAAHLGPVQTVEVHLEDAPHRGRFGLVDHKALFLALGRWQVDFFGLVAKWRLGAIEEALPGVLFQGPQRVLAGFLALVFVEQTEDAPRHLAGRIITGLLRDRN
nr:hypothetical protein [Rhodoferax sediminis]